MTLYALRTPAAPTVTGGLTMRRGEFTLLGRRLTFRRGVVTLDNLDRIDPRLDFVASTNVQSTTINVEIGGTSRAPTIAVTSVPSLPPDEAMALLLFGKPASGLSAFELAQAAQGLAELTGQPSGSGVLGRLRSGLGPSSTLQGRVRTLLDDSAAAIWEGRQEGAAWDGPLFGTGWALGSRKSCPPSAASQGSAAIALLTHANL